MQLYDRLLALDAHLVNHGFHPLTDKWKADFQRFLNSDAKQGIWRAGRRAGKSSSFCRFAVLWALYADHAFSQGDLIHIVFVSSKQPEARQRLRTIGRILETLGRPFDKTKDTIDLRDRPIRFAAMPATAISAVGWTSALVICDELARWRNKDGSAAPASEILTALRPTLKRGSVDLSVS